MPATKSKKAGAQNAENGNIVATAQQTRFHDTDENTSSDIELHDLSISIGQRDILDRTDLVVKAGSRYAFVGRNGLGKSTVLKALAERRIPGVASNVKILMLSQVLISDGNEENDQISEQSQTVLNYVMTSDKQRHRLLRDSNVLSKALEDKSGTPDRIAEVTRQLRFEQAQRDLAQAQLIAERRSGARGSKARQVLKDKEKEVEAAELSLSQHSEQDLTNEIESAMTMLESMQLNLESMDSSTMEARTRTVLKGLGFSDDKTEGPMKNLSGGWRTRALLAAALVQHTDVLLLDEPTNFLDLPAVIWLQHHLTTSLPSTTTLVVTTHDRDFADAIATNLLILRINPPKKLETFTGTMTDYYAEKRRQIRRMTKMSDALDRKKAQIESSVQKSISAAKRAGDDKKLKQAASRKKKAEEHMGMEVNAKGHRFKLNRDRPGFNNSVRGEIEIDEFDPPVTVHFQEQPEPPKTPGSLVSFENVYFTYAKTKTQILDNITLTIQPGASSRTGLVGLNGSGKSTLVNLITQSSSLRPTKGIIAVHPTARIAHYSQHTTESLISLGLANPNLTALTYLQSLHPTLPEQSLRAHLSALSLHPQHQTYTPLHQLSGGQLVRVALATNLLPLPPHLLILDEVTTHLDSDSILALISALKRYRGALLVVSHDRFFMRCVVEGQSASAGRVDVEDDATTSSDESSSSDEDSNSAGTKEPGRIYRLTKTGKMQFMERGMDQYEEIVIRNLARQGVKI